ncbi:MAG: fumarate hydratase [Candidatus Omnitrophota bacterium]
MSMREISTNKITQVIATLCIKANTKLPAQIVKMLKYARDSERQKLPRDILSALLQNAQIAEKGNIPICQDTGMTVVFVEIGQEVRITGGTLKQAITRGVRKGYQQGYLRKSVVRDPLFRKNTQDNTPPVMHIDLVSGDRLKLTVMPKGFGCENKSWVGMLSPTASVDEIIGVVRDAVKNAGADACPPYFIGVGIGGTHDKAVLLAKEALIMIAHKKKGASGNASLENKMLKEINNLKIGPMGLRGKNTALALQIKTFPTHIAGLPVAVNISCHALRLASQVL